MSAATGLRYLSGFGNEHATEAVAGALPLGQNSPQRAPLGLYAEQISGTAFTAPRHQNRRSWFYRIRPGVTHGAFAPDDKGFARWHDRFDEVATPPDQLRWDPLPLPTVPTDFIAGMTSFGGNGGAGLGTGVGILLYACNASMTTRHFYDADGELLIVPQQGRLRIATEMGLLEVAPGSIAVVPRGVRFRVELLDPAARGWVAENFGAPLRLPELGPIGSNGLANARDFEYPVAAYEDRDGAYELIAKFQGRFHRAAMDHSPLDVVAWHGTHAPYRYELARFNTIGSISFDHPDPSIFTVLTSPSDTPGTANLDFVVFGPRWLAMEHTFRPPWYHRNAASEFMGLVHGVYDAKESGGFVPGGSSLHNCMSGHGPDAGVYEKASAADTRTPHKVADSLAFMFETRAVIKTTRFALECPQRQKDYIDCWQGLKKSFVAPKAQ